MIGLENTNTDRLTWLATHTDQDGNFFITDVQEMAGKRFQADWQIAVIANFASMGALSGPTKGIPGTLADAKVDAITRVNAARLHVGVSGAALLEKVAIDNLGLHDAARVLRFNEKATLPFLRGVLDALVAHYTVVDRVRESAA
jgi:hypothetical protein